MTWDSFHCKVLFTGQTFSEVKWTCFIHFKTLSHIVFHDNPQKNSKNIEQRNKDNREKDAGNNDSSMKFIHHCSDCWDPVDGLISHPIKSFRHNVREKIWLIQKKIVSPSTNPFIKHEPIRFRNAWHAKEVFCVG